MKYVKFQIFIKIIYKNLNSVLTCADMNTGTLIPLLMSLLPMFILSLH